MKKQNKMREINIVPPKLMKVGLKVEKQNHKLDDLTSEQFMEIWNGNHINTLKYFVQLFDLNLLPKKVLKQIESLNLKLVFNLIENGIKPKDGYFQSCEKFHQLVYPLVVKHYKKLELLGV